MFTFIRLLILIALFALLLIACTEPEDEKDPRFVPQLNPHPKYFITVEGDIDPNIADDLTLIWHISYATHNEACLKVTNRFEGVAVPRFTEETVTFLANAGHYRHQFAIDKYLPGFCQWEAYSIDYYFNPKNNAYDVTSATKFTNNMYLAPNSYEITWQCDAKTCNMAHKNVHSPFHLPKQINFHYLANFIRSKK